MEQFEWYFFKWALRFDLYVKDCKHSLNGHLNNFLSFKLPPFLCCDSKWAFNECLYLKRLWHTLQTNGFSALAAAWIYLICFLKVAGSQNRFSQYPHFSIRSLLCVRQWIIKSYFLPNNLLQILHSNIFVVLFLIILRSFLASKWFEPFWCAFSADLDSNIPKHCRQQKNEKVQVARCCSMATMDLFIFVLHKHKVWEFAVDGVLGQMPKGSTPALCECGNAPIGTQLYFMFWCGCPV